MTECDFHSYVAWWYCSKDGIALKEEERPFQLEINAISRSLRKGYEQLKKQISR